jgi:hypothetical protein
LAAIQPLVSSFPRRQLIYTGTVLSGATVFQGFVERGRKALSKTLGYAEWSAPDDLTRMMSDEFVQGSLMSNPSIGFRMTLDAVREEWETAVAALTEDKFLQERWSVWPKSGGVGSVITLDAWSAGETEWRPQFNVTGGSVGIAVSMDRSYAVVAYGLPCPMGCSWRLSRRPGMWIVRRVSCVRGSIGCSVCDGVGISPISGVGGGG